jgi:hypothetical protein
VRPCVRLVRLGQTAGCACVCSGVRARVGDAAMPCTVRLGCQDAAMLCVRQGVRLVRMLRGRVSVRSLAATSPSYFHSDPYIWRLHACGSYYTRVVGTRCNNASRLYIVELRGLPLVSLRDGVRMSAPSH